VSDCSASDIGFVLVDCANGTDVAADTASESAAGSDADSATGIPTGGHA
jgi:hypothetical protein